MRIKGVIIVLKRPLFWVFGVMQCVYVVLGKKKSLINYFTHAVHYCCPSVSHLSEKLIV